MKISMSDATSSTMLVSHHRYFIAHSLVSVKCLSNRWHYDPRTRILLLGPQVFILLLMLFLGQPINLRW